MRPSSHPSSYIYAYKTWLGQTKHIISDHPVKTSSACVRCKRAKVNRMRARSLWRLNLLGHLRTLSVSLDDDCARPWWFIVDIKQLFNISFRLYMHARCVCVCMSIYYILIYVLYIYTQKPYFTNGFSMQTFSNELEFSHTHMWEFTHWSTCYFAIRKKKLLKILRSIYVRLLCHTIYTYVCMYDLWWGKAHGIAACLSARLHFIFI